MQKYWHSSPKSAKIDTMTEVKYITSAADIDIAALNAYWRTSTDVEDYDAAALESYLATDSSHLWIAYQDGQPAGLLLATTVRKPYKASDFLYIDELDTHVEHRRRGVARKLMAAAAAYAESANLDEIWLGTEPDNMAANKLYVSLNPSETEEFVGYTYKVGSI